MQVRDACCSTVANAKPGSSPSSVRYLRAPATPRHQTCAADCICSSEVNSRPRQNRVPNVLHRLLHARFVLRLARPRRVDQRVVVGGQLGVGLVDLRVLQSGPGDTGLQVIRNQPGRDPAEELECRHMRSAPGRLVHLDHRLDEYVSRTGQHNHERRHSDASTTDRIEPHPQLAVVDLGFAARRHRATLTFSRVASSDRFAESHRRTDDSDAVTPRSSRSRCATVAALTCALSQSRTDHGAPRSPARSWPADPDRRPRETTGRHSPPTQPR